MGTNKMSWLEKNRYFWIALFSILFLLSLDFWAWDNGEIVFGFLPIWILWLISLQWILSVLIYFFAKIYWIREDDN